MPAPRLLADEMVGRLARYLRMVGCDTVYAQGWSDDEILARATADQRVVVTRDRLLARRAPRAVLLTSGALDAQMRAVRSAIPEIPGDISFERCTLCNGVLRPDPSGGVVGPSPDPAGPSGRPRFRCADCGHVYWEGSHTAEVRRRLRAWEAGAGP
jgi:uncharacterized protein